VRSLSYTHKLKTHLFGGVLLFSSGTGLFILPHAERLPALHSVQALLGFECVCGRAGLGDLYEPDGALQNAPCGVRGVVGVL